MSHTHLRIFVASPGDVADERKAIKGIVDEVEKLLQKERAISLDLVMWETDSRPAAGEPQPNINEQIGDYDIFIGLLWKRFGTPTTKAGSGTEEEFNLAYERWLKSEEKPKRPDILFYFCKKPFYPDSDEEHEQFGKVLAFRRKHQKSNFFWVYETVDQFKDELRGHLFDTVVARVPLRSAERTETLRAALPSSQTRSLYLQRLASHCRHLPLGAMGSDNDEAAVTLDQVYISLDTTSRQQELAGMGGADDKENPPLSALEAFERNPRLVLLGHPGSGKSTFVNEVLARYAIALQDDTAEPPAGLPRTLTPVKIVLRDFAGRLAAFDDAKLSAKKRRAALADLFRDQAVADLAQFKAADFADGIAAAFETGHCLLVLDGLDEVPPASRVRMRMAVAALLEHFTIRHCIVTCRVRSYQDADTKIAGFDDHTLAPLNDEQKERFAHQWYHTSPQLERLGAEKADTRSKRLTEAAKRRELRDIAGNPMLLTTMAIIHQRDIELPDERARLYHLAVDVMLRRWQRHKVGDEEPSAAIAAFLGSEDRLREAMQRIAYEAHASPAGDDGLADLNRDEAINILKDNKYLGSYAAAEGFLDYADKKSGLLLGRGGDAETPDTYGFPHRTFQEYLAGCYIVSRPNVQGELVTHAEKGDFWYVAVQLGLEEMFYNNKRTWEVLRLAYAFCQDECPEPVHEQRLVLWAGFIANLVKPTFILEDTQTKGGGAAFLARLKAQLVQILRGTLPATERVESGRLLGFLGDPRPEVMDVDQMEFCYVPAGEVLMGTDEKNPISSSDLPQEELDLFWGKGRHAVVLSNEFWIARYPVSNAQYQAFVSDGGYNDRMLWSTNGWHWKEESASALPLDFGVPFTLQNNPVVGVSWYEAAAYASWLTRKYRLAGWLPERWRVALPSEPEWEMAARGAASLPRKVEPVCIQKMSMVKQGRSKNNSMAARTFPWGDDFEVDRANVHETRIESPQTLGCFPGGISPIGAEEMAGNVWEWTRSPYKTYPYTWADEEWEDPIRTDRRSVRGGSFILGLRRAHCAARAWGESDSPYYSVGFRLVLLSFSGEE